MSTEREESDLVEFSWEELDGKVLTIEVNDISATKFQVWGTDDDGNEFLLHTGESPKGEMH